MKVLLTVALLLASSTPKQLGGVSQLANFAGRNGAEVLAYFGNANGLVLIKNGEVVKLPVRTRLAPEKGCCEHRATPSLSHRGEKIAYVHLASERPRREAVAIYDVMSGASKDVFQADVIWSVAWSPDDATLAAVADDGNTNGRGLYLIRPGVEQPAEGSTLDMDISGEPYEISNYAPPSWSPNGDRLAIEFRKKGLGSGNSSASAIGILDPEKKLVLKLADGVDPSWFPSGDEVAYFNPKRNQCLASRLNGEPRVLFKVGKRGAGAGRGPLMFPVVWSPDGKALLFHQWVDPDLITNVYKLDLTSGKSKKLAHSEVYAVSWRSSHPSF